MEGMHLMIASASLEIEEKSDRWRLSRNLYKEHELMIIGLFVLP